MCSKTANGRSISAGIDASNGDLLFVYDGSKKVRGNNNINKDDALTIAEKYIQSRVSANIISETKLNDIKYKEPAADDLPGIYHVSYIRSIRGIPYLSDGIILRVNAETGEVTSYCKKLSTSEEEIALINTEPSITDEEAIKVLKEYMNEDDKIHLAWWIKFVDSRFAEDDNCPAFAWVDAHSGEMLLFDYGRD